MDNTDQEYQEEGGYSDPVGREAMEERVDDGIRAKIKARFHFEDDEIKASFPDRKTLRLFYEDSLKIKKITDLPKIEKEDLVEGEKEVEPEDDYDVTPALAKELSNRRKAREANKKRRDEIHQKQGEKMLAQLPEKTEEETTAKEIDTAKPPRRLSDILGENFEL